jgi:hypothetical protein
MTDDRYRVVLLNGGGQAEGWLTARLRITNVAWDAGDFTYDDAKVFARWASFHIRRGLELCTWTVVHYWCSCGIEFEAPTHEGAVRMQEAHAAEMRHPEAHEGCVF